MLINLALFILREALICVAGEGENTFHLVWYKKLKDIPEPTFYRHVNSLISYGFIIRVRRDTYKLHPLFMKRMIEIVENEQKQDEPVSENQLELWDVIPF